MRHWWRTRSHEVQGIIIGLAYTLAFVLLLIWIAHGGVI